MKIESAVVGHFGVLSKRFVLSGLLLIPIILATGCGVTLGPAYDSAQDNPKNALPESIVIFGDNNGSSEGNKPTRSADAVVAGDTDSVALPRTTEDYKNSAEYKEWLDAKESNTEEYQEFLEFRQWLAFKKLKNTE